MTQEEIDAIKGTFGELSDQEFLDAFIKNSIGDSILVIAIASIILGFLIMIIAIIVKRVRQREDKTYEDAETACVICGILTSAFCIIFICCSISNIIKCKTFPEKAFYDDIKYYLLE